MKVRCLLALFSLNKESKTSFIINRGKALEVISVVSCKINILVIVLKKSLKKDFLPITSDR